jgi:hypothetical protein
MSISIYMKLHVNVIHLSTPRFSTWNLSFRFPHQNTLWNSSVHHSCHTPRSFDSHCYSSAMNELHSLDLLSYMDVGDGKYLKPIYFWIFSDSADIQNETFSSTSQNHFWKRYLFRFVIIHWITELMILSCFNTAGYDITCSATIFSLSACYKVMLKHIYRIKDMWFIRHRLGLHG